jgi:REP element-mobilizing transposase RayT
MLSIWFTLVFPKSLTLKGRANLVFGPMNSEQFRVEHIPLGYLITIRAYGTWLHGIAGSVDRFHNKYGTPKLPANEKRRQYNQRLLAAPPVTLGPKKRRAIELGIKETCEFRKWTLWAINARTNHVHSVVSASCKPKKVATAFKANATRKMREAGVWLSPRSPWVGDSESKKYLWTEKALIDAIAYVLYDQGEPLPE